MRILITGGCGFIGHHLVKYFLENTDFRICIIDKLTYASCGFDRLQDVGAWHNKRVLVLTQDFSLPLSEGVIRECQDIDYILHLGAETHVDRSIDDPTPFVLSNIVGTSNILDLAIRVTNLTKLIYFSTDEVFGVPSDGYKFKEWDRYNTSNPYAATKAAGEELCLAYASTYSIPCCIVHSMNVFGERQNPEKFIPRAIREILIGEKLSIHANSDKVPGLRGYIYAEEVAKALHFLMGKGEQREKYNISESAFLDNLSVAKRVAEVLGTDFDYELTPLDKAGHDFSYALDGTKLKTLGWEPLKNFNEKLEQVVEFSLKNLKWLNEG